MVEILTAEKAKGKMVETSSSKDSNNRLSILERVDTAAVEGEGIRDLTVEVEVEKNPPRKPRAASARVAEVMKQVKPKKRSPPQKGNSKTVRTTQTSSSSSLPTIFQ